MQIPNIVLVADAAVRNVRSAISIALHILAVSKNWAQVAYTSARRANLRLFGSQEAAETDLRFIRRVQF